MDHKASPRPEAFEGLRNYSPAVRDSLSSEAFERLDNILRLASTGARAPVAEQARGLEERSIHQAVDVVQRASKALEQMEARFVEAEARAIAVSARAAEEIKNMDARLKAAEQRSRDLNERAEQAERRAREAETRADARIRVAEQRAREADARAEAAERNGQQANEWLRRLHDSITESFQNSLSGTDWLRQIDSAAAIRPLRAVGA